MGTYRKEWHCCDSVTETEAWEPENCPFCTDDAAPFRKDAERYRKLRRGQHWSVINGIGEELRADELDASVDAVPDVGAANVA